MARNNRFTCIEPLKPIDDWKTKGQIEVVRDKTTIQSLSVITLHDDQTKACLFV